MRHAPYPTFLNDRETWANRAGGAHDVIPTLFGRVGRLRLSGSQFQRRRSSELRLDVTLGADFDARTGVVVVLQLQIIVVAVPVLVGQTAIPITADAAEIPRTQVANFLTVR